MKAVLHFRISAATEQRFRHALPDWLELTCVDAQDNAQARRALRDADVLLHVLEPATAELLEDAAALRLIQKIGVGVNTIDLDFARERGIAVANMPGTNSQAVCEQVLALTFATLRRVVYYDAATRAGGGWTQPPETADDCREIGGRTVGLLGYGEVPRRLAPVLEALGARVVFSRRTLTGDEAGAPVSLDELIETADIISLHAPLTDATRHLIDAQSIAKMKDGVVLINTARGALIDEAALIEALSAGKISAAGLDVFEQEPLADDNPLLAMPNVVVSPHIAWLTVETIERSLAVIVDNCERLRDGRPLRHRVEP